MLVVILAAVAILVVAASAIGRSRHRGAVGPDAPSTADPDVWNATVIGGATGHAWLAGEHAARARAVTDAARRGPPD